MHRMGGDVREMFDQLAAFFATAVAAEFEEGRLHGPMPVAAAREWLAERYRQRVDDPDWYCDIIARK
jgi:hypothetical protein